MNISPNRQIKIYKKNVRSKFETIFISNLGNMVPG